MLFLTRACRPSAGLAGSVLTDPLTRFLTKLSILDSPRMTNK